MVSSTPRPHFTPGKDTVPILQETGWAPGPVWTGGKSRPHRDSISDRPACSQSLYRLSYSAHIYTYIYIYVYKRASFATLGTYDAVEEENVSPTWESNPDILIFQPRNIVTALTSVPELLR